MALQERRLKGIAVSPGISSGELRVELRGSIVPATKSISIDCVEEEWARFDDALNQTEKEISEFITRVEAKSGAYEAAIFDAHLLLLRDSTILKKVRARLNERKENIEAVYYTVVQEFMDVFRALKNDYLRSRVVDMEDVLQRVLKNLAHTHDVKESPASKKPRVLAAYDLTPSDTADMDRQLILGFVTEVGSSVSHTAILARSLGIPAIVAIPNLITEVRVKQQVIIDGYSGTLILNPSDETSAHYKKLQEEKNKAYQELVEMKDLPSQTLDGHRIRLAANVEFSYEYKTLIESGAEGVGLYRTEFFLLGQSELPDEEAQYKHYRELIDVCAPHEVVFRSLDSGGDKFSFVDDLVKEDNPFLGWRGIRVSLECTEFFKTQLRAVLRASAHGKVGLMFPMVSGYFEVQRIKALLEECREELRERDIAFDPEMKVGIMIEVPSAAIIADVLAPYVDFFSIGSNDLTQYTIAVDRVNHKVASMFRPAHPAVIRLIKLTIQAGIPTSICGEIGSDLTLLPLLVGLGAVELSVGAHMIPVVRYAIRHLNYQECIELADAVLKMSNNIEIREHCHALAQKSYPLLFS